MSLDLLTAQEPIEKAARLLMASHKTVAFSGAGISVESGIPDFRGPDGIWSQIDTKYLDISYFQHHGEKCWEVIRPMFFDPLVKAEPNPAHHILSWMEQKRMLSGIITQNIDNLHHKAGNTTIVEFHGNTRTLVCANCGYSGPADFSINGFPPVCPTCRTTLKPDFVFFGEAIPSHVWTDTENLLKDLDLMLVIGTTGIVFPASQIPRQAKDNGAKIVEINIQPSEYTHAISDIFIQQPASEALTALKNSLLKQHGLP
jgi:NAD-dependent deacetylase